MMQITGKTQVLGIIGCPVSHSLSPLMQNDALCALELDMIYVPFPVSQCDLGVAVNGLKSLGVLGFNVTIPHKTAIIPFLDRLSDEARLAGAVNTVKREGEAFVGYNTDGAGFVASLRQDLDFDPNGANILVLGAGGAARGGIAALCSAGASSITIANRSPDKGLEIVQILDNAYIGMQFASIPLASEPLAEVLPRVDLLVNTTSVGMDGTSFAGLDLNLLRKNAVVYDMVYSPPETPLLRESRAAGLRAANGLGMLAGQGEAAFRIWTGQDPPYGVMRNRLVKEMAARAKK